ncbi:MAG: SMP-30/gluconolactonase/LRE family protein [Bryobacteraceae bacterium]
MTRRSLLILATAVLPARAGPDIYVLGPDSQRQPGVPEGKVTKYDWVSKTYPGTFRNYWVYVPAQYKAARPACVMVFLDGGGFVSETGSYRATIVLDNLIARGDMPVTIGVFVDPGVARTTNSDAQARYNRSFEYDTIEEWNAEFLLGEILPKVSEQYNLSRDPNDRGIGGASSGGIAAFTAAWFRPDGFRRVLSFIGSFTNLRGGEIYASLVRKTEPAPLRIFQQDGAHDQDIWAGNWYIGNQNLASALSFAGYDAKFVVGTETHNGKQGGAILPDALPWLWRDYPKPIAKSTSRAGRQTVMDIIEPGADWELVSSGHQLTEGPAVDREGNVFFTDPPANRIYKITTATGKVTLFKEQSGGVVGMMFGPDGRLYGCQNGRKRIVAYTSDGTESVLAEGVTSNDLAINIDGIIYFSDPDNKLVWRLDAKGNKRAVNNEVEYPNGVRFSPDQSLLYVNDTKGRYVWSFQVAADGSLQYGEPFFRLETDDIETASGADGMTVDDQGFVYVVTRVGLQVCDQAGRVEAILRKPQPGHFSNAVFGGPDLQTLYVTAGNSVFRRRLQRKGVVAWAPMKPPMPRL